MQSNLFKISSLNGVSVLVRILGGLIASKVIATFIGPAGNAIIGNFRSFLTTLDAVATLGFQNGVIKYVAENEKDTFKLHRVLATSFLSILLIILVLGVLLFFAANPLNSYFFGNRHNYAWIFKIVAFSLPWYAGSLLLMSVVNGLGMYNKVIIINIWGNILGVLSSAFLIWKLDVEGAFLGLIITPAFTFLFSGYLLFKKFPGVTFLRFKNFDDKILKGLLAFSSMALVTAVLGSIINVEIRNTLIDNYSETEAGFWDAMTRISTFYLMFVSTLLTVYFLPKLSMAVNTAETKKVIFNYYKLIVPLFIAGAIAIYFLREFVVRLVLSEEYLPVTELFFWQLAGDFFKVCSLILGYQFFAKKMTGAFIVTEIFSFCVLYFSSIFLIKLYGAQGAVMAHTVTYFVYLVVLIIYFRIVIFRRKSQ